MTLKQLIIFLLCLAIILLAADIFTGIWYWNRLNLQFDADNYNQIITPTAAIIGIVIYSWALFTSIRQNKIIEGQNKIIASQNIKPFIEKEIDDLKTEAAAINFDSDIVHKGKIVNGLNYIRSIGETFSILTKSKDYNSDLREFEKNGKIFDKEYFENRDYFSEGIYLVQFCIGAPPSLRFLYDKLKDLIIEIEKSKLIDEDKIYLKRKIKKIFLAEYIALISFMDIYPYIDPPVPMVFQYPNYSGFIQLNKSDFRKGYEWFVNHLSKEQLEEEAMD
jgi:hypothetical protein